MAKIRNTQNDPKIGRQVTVGEFYCGLSPEEKCCRFWHLNFDERYTLAKDAHRKVMHGAENLFFWGHPLNEIMKSNLFTNLTDHITTIIGCDNYTIEIFNTLIMFALYKEPTSRIVQVHGKKNGKVFEHDWVEFKYHDMWYLADGYNMKAYDWLNLACDVTHFAVNEENIQEMSVIEHEAFWQPTVVKRLNYLMRNPETSSFWSELRYSIWNDPEALSWIGSLADGVEAGQKPGHVITDPYHPYKGFILIEEGQINALM